MRITKNYFFIFILLIFTSSFFVSTNNSVIAENGDYVKLENAFSDIIFQKPVDFQHAGDNSNRVFVVEKAGIIKVLVNSNTTNTTNTFLDITDRVKSDGGEEGLLGLTFHPDYNVNGYFFVYYSAADPRRSVVSRFSVSETNPDAANLTSELILMEILQPYANHNGGQISFGPDGYFYIGPGDGGSSGDPLGNGQNLETLLGAILRIDVDTIVNGTYSIPTDNPFYENTNNYMEEIYAYGLRNPWRFSFDPVTEMLWVADVGQNAVEEIDIIENGSNYGWNIKEGSLCYNPPSDCNSTGLIDPIWEYSHSVGNSITGGYVYRGETLVSHVGKYFYADYVNGQIWALEYDNIHQTNNTLLIETGLRISSFGIDEDNNLFVLDYVGGQVLKLENSPTIILRTMSPLSIFVSLSSVVIISAIVFYRRKRSN